MSRRRRLILLVWAVLAALPLSAQQTDSLVRLVYSDKGELLEIDGEPCRKLTGNTRFLHNGTYLLCDTALWHVNRKLIRFSGHVRIIQDRTSLTSDNADYLIDQDLAQFRGSLVELQDRDGNILRTRNLDYNTADSVAVFQDGGIGKAFAEVSQLRQLFQRLIGMGVVPNESPVRWISIIAQFPVSIPDVRKADSPVIGVGTVFFRIQAADCRDEPFLKETRVFIAVRRMDPAGFGEQQQKSVFLPETADPGDLPDHLRRDEVRPFIDIQTEKTQEAEIRLPGLLYLLHLITNRHNGNYEK